MLENTVVDPAATEHAQKRLENILIKIGEREAPSENKEKLSAVGEAISKFISDALYECVGAQGTTMRSNSCWSLSENTSLSPHKQ